MASYIRLRSNIDDIIDNIYLKTLEAEEARYREFHAAVQIQSWFRGTRIRRYIQHLEASATKIQRHWRGFLGRKYYRQILSNSVDKMCINNYNAMATKIQKVWRGYFTRKYIYDYYSRKQYLESIQEKNESIRRELALYEENMRLEKLKQEEQEYIARQMKWADKNHHLISTFTQPGIFNSPFLKDPLPPERLLRQVKPRKLGPFERKKLSHQEVEEQIRSSYPVKLPPIPPYKPQGPFKEPHKVWEQRFKPLNPTLRVQTDFYSLEEAQEERKREEWTKRLHDEVFMPARLYDANYEPMLITSSKFGLVDYGTKHFREVQPNQHTGGPFKSLVPRIHVFDRLNKDYLEGYVEQ